MNHFIEKHKGNLIIASGIAIIFFLLNFILISNGHFHEDAYILFIYVENFINGNGIAYYPGGPHAEGATDFLWLVLLIILGKIGLDTGTSVILLNSIGVLIICFLLSVEITNSKINNKKLLFLLYPFVFLWALGQPLIAAVGGFSVFLYMALILLAFVSVHKEKYIVYTPYISITIALFRPDGVIIGIGFTLVGLWKAYNNNQVRQYLSGALVGLTVGISYFIWRYNYFGNLLPLPLYVKSHASLTAGHGKNLTWLKSNLYLLIPIYFLAKSNLNIKYYVTLASPVILLFVALIAVTQSQNVGLRFQAPVFIIAYYIFLILLIEYMEKNTINKPFQWLLMIYVIGLTTIGFKHLNETRNIVQFNYINQAPLLIKKILPAKSTIALTEAGRLAYWNQTGNHTIIDLVGLNSEFPAKNTISIKYLEALPPDMIMYHHARKINTAWLRDYNKKVILLTVDNKNHLANNKLFSDSERKLLKKSDNASIITTQYLQKYFMEFDIYFVDYDEKQTFSHVYAFRKSLLLRDKIKILLEESFQRKTALSYYEMLEILKSERLNTRK